MSPEVAADRRVTFRLRAPEARAVSVSGQWAKEKIALTKDADGVWSAVTGPVEAGVWEYSLSVDGVTMIDPANPQVKPQRSPRTSILEVPGTPPLVTEFQDVPHGAIHVHQYRSRATGGLRRVHVYTPPGYEKGATRYPVMFLFHGMGDNDAAWSVHGRAPFIVDNLLAQKKARPMVVVMTDGHPVPLEARSQAEMMTYFKENTPAFQRDLLEEVLPLVERTYRVRTDAGSRAVVGLSMGGHQALTVGLTNPDKFAWVGAFSAAAPGKEELTLDPKALKGKVRWLWIGCGKEDFLLKRNEAFVAALAEQGIAHEWRLTDGGHSWPIWRQYLAEVVPALFAPGRR